MTGRTHGHGPARRRSRNPDEGEGAAVNAIARTARGRRARWPLLGTAAAQAVSPLLVGFDGNEADPVIVPPRSSPPSGVWWCWGRSRPHSGAAAVPGRPGA